MARALPDAHRASAQARPTRLHIERVELVGMALTRADARRFRGALGSELDRLVRDQGLGDVTTTRLPGAIAAPVHAGVAPAQLGRDVARSLFAALRSRT